MTTGRQIAAFLGAVILAFAGYQLVSVHAVLSDSILEYIANGMGWIAFGMAALSAAYGFGAPIKPRGREFRDCPECAESIPAMAKRCPRCTSMLSVEPCPHCGATTLKTDLTCWSCGIQFNDDESDGPESP
jgi:hypothetical protein